MAVRTRRGFVSGPPGDELLRLLARDGEHLALMRRARAGSYLVAPMIARDEVLGVIGLAITESPRVFDAADLSLAEELAARAAVAIDHARLFAATRSAHAEVEARTAWLRQLLRGAAMGTWRWEAATDTSVADAETSRLFGLPAEEWRRTAADFMAMVHPDDRGRLAAEHEALFAEGTHFAAEYRIVRADGAVRWMADHGTVFRAPDGCVEALAGVVFDVTEQKEAEARLAQQAQALATLLEHTPDIVERYDREHRCLYANATRERETGLAPATLVGRRIGEMGLPAELVEQWEAMLARVFAEAAPHECELAFPGVHGPAVYDIRCVPEFDADGRVATVLTVSRNVTKHRAAAERLRMVDRMTALGRLSGGMAHEINNMMTAVIGFGDLVLRGLGGLHAQRADVEAMVRAAERASGITQQLLAFSRRQIMLTSVFDLSAAAAATVPLLERTLGGRGRLEMRSCATPLPVQADQGQIEQALVHLVLNARDAIDSGGVVTIETRAERIDDAPAPGGGFVPPPGRYAIIEVRDTGAGMDAETLARAFEPFFTTKPVGQGIGLGLSTVYGVVKQSGGYVTLASEPGGGTRVCVRLPLLEGGAPAGAAAAPVGAGAAAGAVLVVGGEPVVRALLRRSFELHGFRVLDAARAEEALGGVPAGSVALVVCDLDADRGDDTARLLAARLPAAPLLCVSAASAPELAERASLPPGTAVVRKPFAPEAIVARARQLIAARAAR
jgi:PAS domain S-box-containing protein